MLDLIREMFWSPEDHRNAYEWATVLLAHMAVGAVFVAVFSLFSKRPVILVSLLYGFIWEGGQLLFAGADPVDCILDWFAVTLGAWLMMAVWKNKSKQIVILLSTGTAILWTGIRNRKK